MLPILEFLGIAAFGLLLVSILDRRTMKRWARSRSPSTWDDLKADWVRADVSSETAAFVREEIMPYYRHGLTPYPEDQLFSTLRIDPGDIEDIVERYWSLPGWALPSLSEPKLVPADPTIIEFAAWLEYAGNTR